MYDIFFNSHPEWKNFVGSKITLIDVSAQTLIGTTSLTCIDAFLEVLSHFGYYREPTAPRDKHANGVAEHTVGLITAKANIAVLAFFSTVPQIYWDLAIDYACTTHSFNYCQKITSPYNLITGRHVDVQYLRRF